MDKILRGRAWKFGDNVDTDVITPMDVYMSSVLGDANAQRIMKEGAFRNVRDEFYKVVKKGDIIVAGRNFGCGSHRESANVVLRLLGFSALVAKSISRIFWRNSIAIGFPSLQAPGVTRMVEEGDELEIDLRSWKLKNLSSGKEIPIQPYTELMQKILEGGGILKLLKQRVQAEKAR